MFQAIGLRADARVGTTIRGKYHLDGVIGVGGMGAVYAATHRNSKRFAVKMLHPELSLNDEIRHRFLREGYAANRVGHPGTVAVLDDDVTEEGVAFLVMELLEGWPVDVLADRCGGLVSVKTAGVIAEQLLDVLTSAHAQGIIHRDIKPSNLFVTNAGRLKVLDFGIARVRDALGTGNPTATGTGKILGSPAFMAPEQALAQSTKVGAQTDIWAAAATLFTLVSGELVHQDDNPALILIHAATKVARPLGSVSVPVPASIAAIVDRGLAFGREDRWANASEMRGALRDAYGALFTVVPDRIPLDDLASVSANRSVEIDPGLDSALNTVSSRTTAPSIPSSNSRDLDAPARMSTSRPVESVASRLTSRSRRWPALAALALLAVALWVSFRLVRGSAVTRSVESAQVAPAGQTSEATNSEVNQRPQASHGEPLGGGADLTDAEAAAPNIDAATFKGAEPYAAAVGGRNEMVAGDRSAQPAYRQGRADETRKAAPLQVKPPAPQVNCNPIFYFDAQGNRVFKKECI